MERLHVVKYITASTGYITRNPELHEKFENRPQELSLPVCIHGLYSCTGDFMRTGWRLFLPEGGTLDADTEGSLTAEYGEEITGLIRTALGMGCSEILFDADGIGPS